MPMRITGLSSGMDIDKMVSDLMKAERIPLDKIKQQRTLTNWKMDSYREVNTKLASLRSTVGNLRFGSDWNAKTVTSSSDSIVSAAVTGPTNSTTHTIVINGNLAQGATMKSGSQISNAGLQGTNAAGLSIDITNNSFNVTLNGVSKTITLGTGSYNVSSLQDELKNKIDAAFGANKVVVDNDGTGKFNFTPTGYESGAVNNKPQLTLQATSGNNGLSNLGFDLTLNPMPSYKINRDSKLSELNSSGKFATPLGSTSGSFTVNGQKISYTGSDSLSAIINRVNTSAAGVTMNYDEVSDSVVFNTRQTGSSAKIELSADTGGLLASLGMDLTAAPAIGKDMDVTIDGVPSKRDSNTFVLDGVTYTAKGPGTATININNDVDSTVKQIKDFVDNYNSTVELINTKLKETKYKDYAPLSDDQKSTMKDADIKLWEDKAKSGLLQNDDILKRALNEMRSFLSDTVSSVSTNTNTLSKIGIETVPYSPGDGGVSINSGKLQIDETKLRQALAADPDGVKNLFSNQSPTSSQNPDPNASSVGIAQRIYNRINKAIDELVTKAGSTSSSLTDRNTDLGLKMFNYNQTILDFTDKLTRKENQYYSKFSAMEKAIQNSNAQISWLSKQSSNG